MTSGHRVTPGLIHDVQEAQERHGYYHIGDLAGIYDGTQDHPAYTGPTRHDAIILTCADAITSFAASDIAVGDKRYRAGMCPDCPDQSCPSCQIHIRDAQAFDQMADRMLQAAQAAPAAAASQPGPDRWSRPAADREVGQ